MVGNIQRNRYQYSRLCGQIDSEKKKLVQIKQLKISIQILETVFERVPQCIMQLSFVLGTFEYDRLKTLLRNSLAKQLNIDSVELVLVVVFGISFWSIIKSLIEFK